jgi:hypothetical protein
VKNNYLISTENEKGNSKKEDDLAENDVEGGWGADVPIEDLEDDASFENALC